MNIDRRVKMMTGVLLLLVLVIGSFLFRSSHKVGSRVKDLEATSELIRSAFMLRILLEEHETHGSRRALKQWMKSHYAIGQILNQEGAFESSDRNLIENVRQTYQAVTSLALQVMKERPDTDGAERREAHEMMLSLMRLRLEQLVNAAVDLNTDSQRTALKNRQMVGGLIMATSLIVVFAVLVNLYLMKRGIVRPIEVLSRGANNINEGNLDFVVGIKSNDEFGKLAQAFNLMIGRLRDYLASLKESEERLRLFIEHAPTALAMFDT